MQKTLTPQKKKILDFINSYSLKKGFSPSQEEMRKKMKLRSIATVNQHLKELEKTGFIKKQKNQRRAISASKDLGVLEIKILGIIAAGSPIEAIEVPNDTITIPKSDLCLGQHYALRVKGDSMINDGIFDGDIVVIRKQNTADDGQTVVAIIDDNEATLKKFYKENKRVRLEPRNPYMSPLFRTDIEIRGVVEKIISNLRTDEQALNQSSLAHRKKVFLDRIKSGSKNNKYKRVALSTIRYAGGKSLAVGHVVELIPDNIKKIVSPFFGGGSIEIAVSKHLGLEVIGYDIFDILCNYWKFQIEKPQLLYERLNKLKPKKSVFEKIRLILNDVWKKKVKLDPLTLAVYYVYNFNLSYGPGFMGWASDIYLNQTRYGRMLERIIDFKPNNLKVECADFRDVIKKHPDDFLYCDPPYYIGEDSKMFKGIYPMRNIPVHHKEFPHEELRDLLKNHRGGFILSYNNCPTIREYYKNFQQSFPSWQYTMGQGETRIGLNRKNGNGNHVKESHEILIFSPPKV